MSRVAQPLRGYGQLRPSGKPRQPAYWRAAGLGSAAIRTFLLYFVISLLTLVRPAAAETIQLERQGGIYMLPVRINGSITLPFVLDSGASDVSIPADVFLTLTRTGTVKTSDFAGSGTYTLADGSEQESKRFVLHELRVGDHVIRNVIANVAPVKGDPLLGQSFLSKLPTWTIDNARHALVLNDMPSPGSVDVPTSLEVVRAFYTALGKADGVNASRLVIPEKRLKGPFAASEITKFYSSLARPLRLVETTPSNVNIVEVQYQYASPDGRPCQGKAVVNLVGRGDELLIESIQASDHC